VLAGKAGKAGALPALALPEHLSGAPLWGRLLALPTNNRQCWKAYHEQTLYLITKMYNLIELQHWPQV
jgi:hypothetical protein